MAKSALITGGARGLGEATGRLLAKEGAFVVLTDVLDADGKTLADDIVANGGKASYLHQDVTDEASWSDTMGAIVAEHGRLDIVVNNAGIVSRRPVSRTPLSRVGGGSTASIAEALCFSAPGKRSR